jgi:hypothetical protein
MIGCRNSLLRSFLTVVCCGLLFGFPAFAQGRDGVAERSEIRFGYKFENPRFYISVIEIELSAQGVGEARIKRGESDESIDLKLKLLPATIGRIRTLFSESSFLTSQEDYQNKKDFSHLGWVTLTARDGEQSRTARFNYTLRAEIRELSEIFRGLATQEIHVLDLETAQQYQPLDLPRQLESLSDDIRLERITEPERLLAPLRDIAASDTLPLIARNTAKRIAMDIEKGKFKTPMKSPGR